MGMPTAAERFDEMGIIVRASRALRTLGTPIALHQAEELEGVTDGLLDAALKEGADIEFALDEMPGEEIEEEEEDVERLEDLEQQLDRAIQDVEEMEEREQHEVDELECPECEEEEEEGAELLGSEPHPLGAPNDAPGEKPLAASARSRAKGKAKVGKRRKYVACSPPELRRGSGGRKAWCSLCAYRRAGGNLGWSYLPVGKNPLIKPRFALLSGRRIRFASEEELDSLLSA